MRDTVYIGGTPCYEPCASIGHTDDFATLNRLECRAYIVGLKIKYGEPPEGARLVVYANPHDFGTYWEVVCSYDTADAAALEYATKVENGLMTWDEVGMWPPVIYDGSTPLAVTENDERLWLKASNPHRHCRVADLAPPTETEPG